MSGSSQGCPGGAATALIHQIPRRSADALRDNFDTRASVASTYGLDSAIDAGMLCAVNTSRACRQLYQSVSDAFASSLQ